MPLRVHLVTVVTVLLTLALTGAGWAATEVMSGHLIGQVDTKLEQNAKRVAARVEASGTLRALPEPGTEPGRGPLVSTTSLIQIRSSQGTVLAQTPEPGDDPALVLPSFMPGMAADQPFTVPGAPGQGHAWRVIQRETDATDRSVLVAVSLEDVEATLTRLESAIRQIGLVTVVLLTVIAYLVIRFSLRPLLRMEATAEAIAAGDLSARAPEAGPRTEVGRLGNALNRMLGEIETAFQARQASEAAAREAEHRMRRFVADASHELRTPLTSTRGYAELYRQGAIRDREHLDRVMRRIEGESVRMAALVDDLLLLARLDREPEQEHTALDLTPLLVDAVQDARAAQRDRTIRLVLPHAPRPTGSHSDTTIHGNEARLRQVLANLIGNALHHTPPGTTVDVRLEHQSTDAGQWAVLVVADNGPGIQPGQLARIFERFYRADPARSRDNGGAGLGLSIVQAIVAQHQGRVYAHSAPGEGTVFRVWLPLH
ncbi:HAMP domain-containing protein [Streptomyces parvus]|uniref:histidine kinase n=1 Tax=Streptomyces parvus TaxID=66428 RepID=A0A5D4JIU8_9ACTN|nr:HAMP domain-containing protein [Streptomyces parvus]